MLTHTHTRRLLFSDLINGSDFVIAYTFRTTNVIVTERYLKHTRTVFCRFVGVFDMCSIVVWRNRRLGQGDDGLQRFLFSPGNPKRIFICTLTTRSSSIFLWKEFNGFKRCPPENVSRYLHANYTNGTRTPYLDIELPFTTSVHDVDGTAWFRKKKNICLYIFCVGHRS